MRRLDAESPNAARMYNWFLGGAINFPADRRAAKAIAQLSPDVHATARANRGFLERAVKYMAGQGIRQFLDLGTGYPAAINVHQVTAQTAPDARVVYVDIDPVVLTHTAALLDGRSSVRVVHGDLRAPHLILRDPQVRAMIDLTKPVGILLLAVLHFIDHDLAYSAASYLRHAVAPGSYIAVSHAQSGRNPDITRAARAIYSRTGTPLVFRELPGIAQFFGDFEVTSPGIVPVADWFPDDTPADHTRSTGLCCAVAHKTLVQS